MILSSIQPYSFLKELKSKGSIRCDGRKAVNLSVDRGQRRRWPNLEEGNFERSYRWMVQQMKERSIQKDNKYPLWCWQSYVVKNRIPSIPQCKSMSESKDKPVRLILDVPDELVILSDFYKWHDILNNMCICDNEKYIDKVYLKIRFGSKEDKEKYTSIKEKSWQKVFDLDLIDGNYIVQACIPRMEKNWIVRVDNIWQSII